MEEKKSVNFTIVPNDDPDALALADQALYRAKSLGGNRLEVAQIGLRPAAA